MSAVVPEATDLAVRARREADAAAAAAGIEVRSLHSVEDMATAVRVQQAIWGSADPRDVPVDAKLMRALEHSGGYVHGVYAVEDPDTMVGVCVAFSSTPVQRSMHSHVAGVQQAQALRGVGRALKLDQRAWALEHGMEEVTWTFDPLVSRNAHFNIVKLGARLEEYLEDFYGEMTDGVNAGDRSDRVVMRWRLDEPSVVALAGGGAADEVPAHGAVVAVPDDIEALRRAAPDEARAWRQSLRAELVDRLAQGWQVVGFARGRGYLLAERPAPGAAQG